MTIELPQFKRNPQCTACDLFSENRREGRPSTVCIPTVPFKPPTGKTQALLVVGEAPGFHETVNLAPFVGPSGHLLRTCYIDPKDSRPLLWRFTDVADVYLTNAVRCRPPANRSPNATERKACRAFLAGDVSELSRAYARVTILCVGTTATQAVLGMKVTAAFRNQGAWATIADLPVRVFSTWHPAVLLPRRDPSRALSVCDHLQLLDDHLNDRSIWKVPDDFPDPTVAPLPPSYAVDLAALDIETYSAVSGYPSQKTDGFFHPAKSHKLHGIPPSEIIKTVAIAWPDQDGNDQSAIFVLGNPTHRTALERWFRYFRDHSTLIVGMNLKFDLLYLRYCYPTWGALWLNHHMPIADISVLNYLQNELRPERSLKDLSALFNITAYQHTLRDTTFKTPDDPLLWRYNAEDCLATLCLYRLLRRKITDIYGEQSYKLSDYSAKWYSDLLWTTIYMSEDGVAMNTAMLTALYEEHSTALHQIASKFYADFDMPLAGKGSGTALNTIIDEAAAASGITHKLELTEKTSKIKFDKANAALLLEALPPDSIHHQRVSRVQQFKYHQKLLSSYLEPLLFGKAKNKKGARASVLIDGIAYPDWYPVPGHVKDDDGDDGGTIQCRMTCKKPGLQTNPKITKAAIDVELDPGYVLVIDLSQVELRYAGWLSDDALFRDVYEAGRDLHAETALEFFGEGIRQMPPDEYDTYRQAGKKTNFLRLFLGGAETLHLSILKDLGLDIPIDRCDELIVRHTALYKGLHEWQQRQIKDATTQGFLELPLSGAGRLFSGSEKTVLKTYINTIVNLPIQASAAKHLISAQGEVVRAFRDRRMKSRSGLQIYDSLYARGPLHELPAAASIVVDLVKYPPFYHDMAAHLGRTFPFDADLKIWTKRNGILTKGLLT